MPGAVAEHRVPPLADDGTPTRWMGCSTGQIRPTCTTAQARKVWGRGCDVPADVVTLTHPGDDMIRMRLCSG